MLPQIFDAGYHAIRTEDRAFPGRMHPHIGEEFGDGRLAELVVALGDCFVQIEEGNLLRLGDGAGPSGMTIAGPPDLAVAPDVSWHEGPDESPGTLRLGVGDV